MTTVVDIATDLAGEHRELARMLDSLTDSDWSLDTPSPGWSVADQVGHLGYFDITAAQAITDPEGFKTDAARALSEIETEGTELFLAEPRSMSPEALRGWWLEASSSLIDAAGSLEDSTRVPWYGPEMGSKSFLSARLMETWAHGQDIADATGFDRRHSTRLQHIVRLGINTRGWSYAIRGMDLPESAVLVSLASPDGVEWSSGDSDATETISGPAADFCQVVTQRRHVDDTDLEVSGATAREWMLIAQAFAGGPTEGPPPRSTS